MCFGKAAIARPRAPPPRRHNRMRAGRSPYTACARVIEITQLVPGFRMENWRAWGGRSVWACGRPAAAGQWAAGVRAAATRRAASEASGQGVGWCEMSRRARIAPRCPHTIMTLRKVIDVFEPCNDGNTVCSQRSGSNVYHPSQRSGSEFRLRSDSTSVYLNYLKDCTVSEVIK